MKDTLVSNLHYLSKLI